METKRFFKTKMVRGGVELEFNSEDDSVRILVMHQYGPSQHLTLSRADMAEFAKLLNQMEDAINSEESK